MEQKVLQTIQKYRMFAAGESVAVAVSGGKDSTALLLALVHLRRQLDLRLIAVHVHHGIRAGEAERDEAFVQQLCAALGVPFRGFHFDVPRLAKARGIGLEECGRQLRYEALESIGADKIATAHTLSDSIETMLFHLSRGSGAKGLSGIPPVRGNIVRPLIACTSDEVVAYLAEQHQAFVEDSTNKEDIYARNALRHRVVEPLKALNPAFEANAGKAMEILAAQQAYMEAQAQSFLAQNGADAAKIAALPQALQSQVLRCLCAQHLGTVPEYRHIEQLAAILESGGQVQINGGALIRVRAGRVEFPQPVQEAAYSFALREGKFALPIGTLVVKKLNCKQFENLKINRFSFALDYDTIKSDLICRNRHGGDRFYDGRRRLHKSLKKHLSEMAVEPERRQAFPVFLSGDTVIGTLGSSPAGELAPSRQTKSVLYIYLEGDYHGRDEK